MARSEPPAANGRITCSSGFGRQSQAGGLDTAWVAYNNFFDGSGHIFAGKLEVPAPSEFSQWLDVSGLTVNSQAEITVGEHAYELDGNRWG